MVRLGGIAAMVGVAVFVAIAATLHALQPGYDPRQQLMSELALGPHGWAMLFAFAGIAAAIAGVAVGVAGLRASAGLQAVVWLAAALFLAAGVFPLGPTSEIHIGAIAAAFVAAVLAMYLFPSLAGDAAPLADRAVSWSCAAGIAGAVALGHTLLPMGIGQRLAAAFLLAWIARLGWKLVRRDQTYSHG